MMFGAVGSVPLDRGVERLQHFQGVVVLHKSHDVQVPQPHRPLGVGERRFVLDVVVEISLAPLKDLSLRELACDERLLADTEVLRSLKKLEKINEMPAAVK